MAFATRRRLIAHGLGLAVWAGLLGAGVGAGLGVGAGAARGAEEPPLVGITAIVEHPSLDAARRGVMEGLTRQGLVEGRDFRAVFKSAQGAPATAAQIARGFVGDGAAVIVAISTPSAQAAAGASRVVPIVFAAVTDPIAAGLVKDPKQPGGNITGVQDKPPIADQVALMREILPGLRHIGTLYNPGEINAAVQVRELKAEAARRDLDVYEAAIARPADVAGAVRTLLDRVEAFWIPSDNTVIQALEAALATARGAHVPVFASDAESVARGAIASIGLDYQASGRLAGEKAAWILRGRAPGGMPVESTPGRELVINLAAADRFGVAIPEAIRARAARLLP